MSNGESGKEREKEEKGKILRLIKKECKEVSVSRKRPWRMGRSGKRKQYNSVSVVKKRGSGRQIWQLQRLPRRITALVSLCSQRLITDLWLLS